MGAGPAGMAAARTAADAGAEVVLVDAEPAAGGQYLRGAVTFTHPGVTLETNAEAWTVHGNTLFLKGSRTITFVALVLATGAHDRVLPFPGWTEPGVVTAGAAQALAKQGVAIGKRVIVAGTGPFLLPVADTLMKLGVDVIGVYEAGSPLSWLREPRALLAGWRKIAELFRYRKVFPRYRIRTAVVAKDKNEVTVARLDRHWRPRVTRKITVDAVCVGFGFLPRHDLAAHCDLDNGFVKVNERQATSTENIYAAGEITGIGGADLAEAEGIVAGAAAAGREPTEQELRRVRRGRTFAAGLARAHAPRDGWRTWLAPDTTICRCERVPLEALTQADGMRALKLSSRVAMGRCQGRMCGHLVQELTGIPFTTKRIIATPIPLGELAALEEPWNDSTA
ncbi:pyridine nucleotide-disulfide oxidoreductase [Lentzea sp. NBRC 105346]|nr:pyridine nucleotide-disulfide oxidoreductase [Lentzea sp. NBRC 105346]